MSYDASAVPLLQNLGWPSIRDLIKKEIATLTCKALLTYVSVNAQRAVFAIFALLKQTCRTCTGQKAFTYRGAKLWNELNKESELAPSLATFIKIHMRGTFYFYI